MGGTQPPAPVTQTAGTWEIKSSWAPDGQLCAWQTLTSNWAIYQDAVPVVGEPGLVARFPLNGNAEDATGNGHNGSVVGPVAAADRNGTAGGACAFDGTDDYNGSSRSSSTGTRPRA